MKEFYFTFSPHFPSWNPIRTILNLTAMLESVIFQFLNILYSEKMS